jgi:dihydrofolate reductase
MAKLIYTAITSLDGYNADEDGNFDWAAPDEEVHSFVNDLERPVGTYLYGRRMYELMAPWETPCPPEARTAGRTPFQQRRGSPPLRHQDLRRRRHCSDDLVALILGASWTLQRRITCCVG